MNLSDLSTPALLLDIDILERNLASMQERTNRLGTRLRPHIKTHKCIEIARRQRELGASGLTVSTFYEAQQFAAAGFDDLLWALPIPAPYITRLPELHPGTTLQVLVDSLDAVALLETRLPAAAAPVHVWVEIDPGLHRTGLLPDSPEIEQIADRLVSSQRLRFAGILTHGGQSYGASSQAELKVFAANERDVMLGVAERLRRRGFSVPGISIGSTPTLSIAENLNGITEIRPGNYVFFDYSQVKISSCTVADCAVTVLASVVSHQKGASHFVTDAGALALSKDPGPTHTGNPGMGRIYADYREHRLEEGVAMRSLSQEHGPAHADSAELIEGRFPVGGTVRILENHSCLTAAQFDHYTLVRGDEVLGTWNVLRGRG